MKTTTILASALTPGQRYFAGETVDPFGEMTPTSPYEVHEVSARHRLQPSEDAIGEEGYVVIWRDNAKRSTGMDVYLPGTTVEVIEEDARMDDEVLVRHADGQYFDVMISHHANFLPHGSVENVLRHQAYLEFVEERLAHVAIRQHPLRAHAA